MVFKRKRKGSFKKKWGGRRRGFKKAWRKKKGGKTRVLTLKSPVLFPDAYVCKLKWSGGVKQTTDMPYSYALATNTLLGSVIDQSATFGTSHNPIYTALLRSIYTNYTVMAAAIKLTVSNLTSTDILRGVIYPSTVAAPSHAPTDQPPYQTIPYARYKQSSAAGGGRDTITIKHYLATNKVHGMPKASTLIDSHFSGGTASPDQKWFWICAFNNGAGTGSMTFVQNVQITMYTRFYNGVDSTITEVEALAGDDDADEGKGLEELGP